MRGLVASAGLLLAFGWPAFAAEPPAIPDKPEAEQFKDVPAPWRDYMVKARAAERIVDPLQRCLAFPDLPDNEWPNGHAEAHCRHHFAVERPTLDEIGAMVDAGEIARLEKRLGESLRRHFSEDDFGEDIHDTFEYLLRNSDEVTVGRITEAWLEQAPRSAFAHLARGVFFAGSAARARGGKYASETPRANLRRMSELIDKAIPHLEKAAKIEPKLISAYTSLIDVAMRDSRPDLEARAFALAEKIDPACVELANVRMRALEPRWGGSYEEMLAYANRLSVYLPRRPQLAIYVGASFADRGDRLIADDQLDGETMEVLDIAVGLGSNESALRDAANVAFNRTDGKVDNDKGLAYLLQETRFRETSAWGQRVIAWRLVRAEPEWSLKYALDSLAGEPDSAWGHYLAGAGYYNVKRYEDADREYAIAIEDGEQRHASLREVAEMWLWSGDQRDPAARKDAATKAKPYIDRLLREFPDDGRGLAMRFWHDAAVNGRIMVDDARALLPKLDKTDPWQARQAGRLEEMVGQVEKMQKTAQKNR